MSIFKRVTDIVSANLNEMVEKFEEPEKMLQQAVREMENSIHDAKRDVVKAMASAKLVAKELTENERQVRMWEQRAESAVAAGDDGLARKAIARKQESSKLVTALADQHEAASEASQTLRRQLEGMESKLAEAKRRLGTLIARKKAADLQSRLKHSAGDVELNTDAFSKFDRLREKVEMAEAEADAMRELSGATCGSNRPEHEDIPTSDDLDLDAELLQLKKRLQP